MTPWDNDDRRPTLPGCRTKLTLTFDVFYHYNMQPGDIASMADEMTQEILTAASKASRAYEMKKYGSRSEVFSLSGVSVEKV